MNCSACGHTNPERTKFCLECGAALAARCASCDGELPPAAKFCGQCGTQVAAAAASPAERSPRSYTPKHLADKILASRSALEGERKQVTVMFADVKGSMELAESVPIAEVHAQLTRARVLLVLDGAAARAAVETSLDRALALVQSTGARSYEPQIHVERARLAGLLADSAGRLALLREAHRLFSELGATGRAERVAALLEQAPR